MLVDPGPAALTTIMGQTHMGQTHGCHESARISLMATYCRRPIVVASPMPGPHTTVKASTAKGREILCTVPGLTPNCSAITRTPGRSGFASAALILASNSGAIDGRPRRIPSLLARARPARTRS